MNKEGAPSPYVFGALFFQYYWDIIQNDRGTIDSLINLFSKYAPSSGQIVNTQKSFIFAGSINDAKLHHITNQLGLNIGHLPFSYLYVHIFKGKPKARYIRLILEKVKAKLSKWKGSLLSFAGKIQMVKSSIAFMLGHSFTFNSWPKSLIKNIEKSIKNLIWSGDIKKSKLVTMA
ncbi:hypothetical protein KIW84_045539 [Lathyrus oleraceus]|uniref:Uncharacterized protein n=1 Tax=Pisum sativum TaxID=3888 RepID=A0A9D5AWV0_PEA|nr:hypothetical protein KIW84_045539 [Pisum sativum]